VNRHRSSDGTIWELLASRAESDGETTPRDVVWLGVKRESAVRLLDAAAGVLTATRHLVAVAEEIVREQRDRLVARTADRIADDEAPAPDSHRRERIDLTY